MSLSSIQSGDCQWNGAWSYDPVTGEWTEPQSTESGDAAAGGLDPMMLIIGGAVLVIIIVASLMFMRRGDEKDDAFAGVEARLWCRCPRSNRAVRTAAHRSGVPRRPLVPLRLSTSEVALRNPLPSLLLPNRQRRNLRPVDQAVYEQYYQQFMSQGYDAATAAAYAQSPAVRCPVRTIATVVPGFD